MTLSSSEYIIKSFEFACVLLLFSLLCTVRCAPPSCSYALRSDADSGPFDCDGCVESGFVFVYSASGILPYTAVISAYSKRCSRFRILGFVFSVSSSILFDSVSCR